MILTSLKERVFCAGANIRMLSQSGHGWKVNFCKFTNETRNGDRGGERGIRPALPHRGERALRRRRLRAGAGDRLDRHGGRRQHAVSLPEVPLLAVLPGTGGLTRLIDKRHVRRDRADVFCTLEEGIKGQRAVEWGLVDEVVPRSRLAETAARTRAAELAARSDRPPDGAGHRAVAARPDDRRGPDRLRPSRPARSIGPGASRRSPWRRRPPPRRTDLAGPPRPGRRRSGRSRSPGSWTT